MNKENTNGAKFKEPSVRVTRARARSLGTSGNSFPPIKPPCKQNQKFVARANCKRSASDGNKVSTFTTAGFQHKRRAVLNDVTNVCCGGSNVYSINSSQIQNTKRGPAKKNINVVLNDSNEIVVSQDDAKTKLAEKLSQISVVESEECTMPVKLEDNESELHREHGLPDLLRVLNSSESARLESSSKKDENIVHEKSVDSKGMEILDIDSNKDPQACSLYAPDIYDNISITELERRPSSDYMEMLQQDITPNMRGILIDWLVEVSEEYKLIPDTLYLTVNMIDRFLSHNYIEKQRLQLLGVTCMLVASKYEEICAPRVEEFCVITDNTYRKEEVLKMESEILNFLHFHLSVPTTKTFLRRFIQAAQASYSVPSIELEFLANYLAELTLIQYSFLKFLPSLTAASAVFLARWILSQSNHPWNATLEHYTTYKASELKTSVVALEDLQLNTSGCPLNAIRDKYKQEKFMCVSTLTSRKPVESLF